MQKYRFLSENVNSTPILCLYLSFCTGYMKKLIIIGVVCIAMLSCNKVNNYYAGYIADGQGQPIRNVLVREYTLNGRSTFTDEKGFFKLDRDPSIICNLIFEKEGYEGDTIRTFNSRSIGENPEECETEYYSILTSDTSKFVLKKVQIR